jgi:hypothetical protein
VGGVGARRDGEERNSAQHQSLHGLSRPGYPRRDAKNATLRNISFFMHGPSRPGYPRRDWGGGGECNSAQHQSLSARTLKTRLP